MRIRRTRHDRTAVGRTPPAKGPTARETALAARIAELEAELRARDDFLAIAAHELRNPMTPISARLELLLARARHMSEGGEFARLSILDEGVGISDCDRALIFERFHRSRRANPNGGFGVGLWVTRQLVRAMRGEISVSSRRGAGSAFTVRLPLRPDVAEHAD